MLSMENTPQLTIQRRHSSGCPDKHKGPDFLKCRKSCKLRVVGYDAAGNRVRESLGTRDLTRATKLFTQRLESWAKPAPPAKTVDDAIAAFNEKKSNKATETVRKYRRVMGFLSAYCTRSGLVAVSEVTLETLDGYILERRRESATWLKEVEILRSFFAFCFKRHWCEENPAEGIERPTYRKDESEIVPYTRDEVSRIIAACDNFGRYSYERTRARAIVLLLRFTGMRIGDVITLSREHVQGGYIRKNAIKNGRLLRIELHPTVTEALDRLPRPKAAPADSQFYFASGTASVRSLVKGAERTLSAVFKVSGVEGAFAHRFRHTFASELLGKGESIDVVASILGDTPAIIRRHYSKWTPEYQARQDSATRKIHDTNLAQAEETAKPC